MSYREPTREEVARVLNVLRAYRFIGSAKRTNLAGLTDMGDRAVRNCLPVIDKAPDRCAVVADPRGGYRLTEDPAEIRGKAADLKSRIAAMQAHVAGLEATAARIEATQTTLPLEAPHGDALQVQS